MSIYKKQDFEAVAVYDYKKDANTQAAVVIDPEYSVVALCFYDQNGNIESSSLWNENNSVSTISLMTRANPGLADWKASTSVMKASLTDFYMSNQMMDSKAFSGNPSILASELMELYKQCGGNELDTAVKSANALLAERAVALSNIRILLVGNMCEFFPAECIARICFSPLMPMLPDNRLAVVSDTETAISGGFKLIENRKSKKIDGNVEWLIRSFDSQNQVVERSVSLAEDQTPVDTFIRAVFNDNIVFAIPEDRITLRVNGVQQYITIPKGFIPDDGALLQLGLQYENKSFSLLLNNNGALISMPINLNVRGE